MDILNLFARLLDYLLYIILRMRYVMQLKFTQNKLCIFTAID